MSCLASPRLRAARLIAADIKLHHSIFAMPFAVLAAFMAAADPAGLIQWGRFGGQLALVVMAMFFARTVAMLANRVLDREIDRANPRTAGRALPSGRLSLRAALFALLGSVAGFMVVCAVFGLVYANWWPLGLGLPVLAWLSVYPLLKRFTSLSHLYLGSSLALSPLGAAVAVDPGMLIQQPGLWLLAGMVMCWVGGFDVIYALQDVEVDRREGLHSVPSRLGVGAALWLSRALHTAAGVLLVLAAGVDPRFGVLFGTGVLVILVLLAVEHLTVTRWGTTRMALVFFTLNGVISCVLGVLGVADMIIGPSP